MSTEPRKISCYYLTLEKTIHTSDEQTQRVSVMNKADLKHYCKYVNSLKNKDKLTDIANSNKSVLLKYLEIYEKEGVTLIKGLMLSGKYNHSPDYISKKDGSARSSEKRMDEAFAEKTHFLGKLGSKGIDLLFESRQSGAGIGITVQSLNKFFRMFLVYAKTKNIKIARGKFYYTNVSIADLDEAIRQLKRICIGKIYYDKDYLLSDEALGSIENTDALQEDIMLTIKAKPKRTISHASAIKLLREIATEDTKISRVRVEGKNLKGSAIVDTLFTKKFDNINVKLDEKGLVDDYSIFSKMEELFGLNE